MIYCVMIQSICLTSWEGFLSDVSGCSQPDLLTALSLHHRKQLNLLNGAAGANATTSERAAPTPGPCPTDVQFLLPGSEEIIE